MTPCTDHDLQITMTLWQYLAKGGAFVDKQQLHQFLVNGLYVPDCVHFLTNIDGVNYVSRLRRIHMELQKAFVYLDDVKMHISYTRTEGQDERTNKELVTLKLAYSEYFGEEAFRRASGTTDKDRCQYRRGQLLRYKALSLRNILDNGESSLREMMKIVECNINSACRTRWTSECSSVEALHSQSNVQPVSLKRRMTTSLGTVVRCSRNVASHP